MVGGLLAPAGRRAPPPPPAPPLPPAPPPRACTCTIKAPSARADVVYARSSGAYALTCLVSAASTCWPLRPAVGTAPATEDQRTRMTSASPSPASACLALTTVNTASASCGGSAQTISSTAPRSSPSATSAALRF